MVSVVTSLLAFFYLSCKQYDDALRILCEKGDAGEEISFNDLYLKGKASGVPKKVTFTVCTSV